MLIKFRYVDCKSKQNYWLIKRFFFAVHKTSHPSFFPPVVHLSLSCHSFSFAALSLSSFCSCGSWSLSCWDRIMKSKLWKRDASECVCVCVFPHYNCVGQSHPSSHSAGIHLLMGGECWEIVGKKRNKLQAHKRGRVLRDKQRKSKKQKSQAAERKYDKYKGTWTIRDD